MKKIIFILLLGLLSTSFLIGEENKTVNKEKQETSTKRNKSGSTFTIGNVSGLFYDFNQNGVLQTTSEGISLTIQSLFGAEKKIGIITNFGIHIPLNYYQYGKNSGIINKNNAGIIFHVKSTNFLGPAFRINTSDFIELTISPGILFNNDYFDTSEIYLQTFNIGVGGIILLNLFANKPVNLTFGTNFNYVFFESAYLYTNTGTQNHFIFMNAFQIKPFVGITFRKR